MLTGAAATDALGIYIRLGSHGARFDGRKVADAVRTRGGRLRLFGALGLLAHARVSLHRPPRANRPARRGLRRRLSVSQRLSAPERPTLPREGFNPGEAI